MPSVSYYLLPVLDGQDAADDQGILGKDEQPVQGLDGAELSDEADERYGGDDNPHDERDVLDQVVSLAEVKADCLKAEHDAARNEQDSDDVLDGTCTALEEGRDALNFRTGNRAADSEEAQAGNNQIDCQRKLDDEDPDGPLLFLWHTKLL